MKTKALTLIVCLLLTLVTKAQQNNQDKPNPKWEKFNWLIGKWKSEGSGQPGQGSGSFAFSFDLGGNVIVRKAHTDFPATQNKPAATHDDLLIIYYDPISEEPKAIYFDNEGHTIYYTISWAVNSIVLTSRQVGGMPAFRLTYILLDKDKVDTVFDMSQDGKTFVTYIEGKSIRVK